jgi:hypothetical protein
MSEHQMYSIWFHSPDGSRTRVMTRGETKNHAIVEVMKYYHIPLYAIKSVRKITLKGI